MLSFSVNADLTLELLNEAHAEELFALADANRQYLRRWLPWLDGARSVEDTRRYAQLTREQHEANNGFRTIIRERGQMVGIVGHHSVDWPNRSCALGYWLAANAQGRGIMTACCRFYVDHAFDEWKLNRFEIRCAEQNVKSRAIPERLGFSLDGIWREAECLYGKFVNLAVYSMLASQWRSSHS